MLLRFPLTAKIEVRGEEEIATIEHVPATSEDIRKKAAEYFVHGRSGRSYREGDTWIAANAGATTWYKILTETPPADRYISEEWYEVIAKNERYHLRIYSMEKELRTEKIRQRINDILKESGSSTRVVKEKGIWLVAREGVSRSEWKPFDDNGIEVSLFYFLDADRYEIDG
jgi:hypothetical protein